MSLDSRWLALVRDTTSKNPDKWVTLSELDNYLNEDETERIIRIEERVFPAAEPDGRSLQERADATDATLSSPLVASKIKAIDALKDAAYETQLNKLLVSPIINDTVTYATLTLDDTDDEDGILLTRKEFGGGGNKPLIKVTESASIEAVSPVFSQTVPNVSINIYVPEAGATLNEVVTAINGVDPMVMSLITAELVSGRTGDESIALLPSGELMSGGGVDHELESTGTEIDNAVTAVGTYEGENDISTDLAAALGDIDALQAVAPEYVDTFATATAAQGTLTLIGNVIEDDEVTIGSITYKFAAGAASAYDVNIGDTAYDTLENLVAAITFDGGVGTNAGTSYGNGTVAHPDVTAAAGEGVTITVTALVKGAAGNAIGTTDPIDDGGVMSWGEAHLENGVDGQVGATGKIIFTDTGVWFCRNGANCAIADSSGWIDLEF